MQQRTSTSDPQCNGMAERLFKTIKHGLIVVTTVPKHENSWDLQTTLHPLWLLMWSTG